ncbi:hypothetical protein [Shewanella sp. MEBiC00475]|uniref:hypothetical protein n=1 Tax=Shewanella sp. MEBiC00475 TaxID=2575361 RepID=UPI0010C0964D|nr:hypothetical protein [Shewanella sp. MEBiC00475]
MTVNILIHIGPPKTGTSAIQFCLKNDRKRLAEAGIFYPEHTTDINGISSGNLNSIFDTVGDDRVLNEAKITQLLELCNRSNFHTLLLSSEFFFERLADIVELLPSARFIAYVRNPLDSFESLYNQSVKRHHHTKPIKNSAKLPRFYLAKLDKFIDQFSAKRFILRSYSSKAFVGGNIIADFYSILGVTPPDNIINQINPSYSFEALEFKRWLNQFCSPQIALKADKLLQAFSSDTQRFTLLNAETFERYKIQAYDYVNDFCVKYDVYMSAALLEDIYSCVSKPYFEQKLSLDQFKVVANYLHECNPSLYRSICYSLYLVSYRRCFRSEFGQYITSKYKLSEVANKNMFKSIITKFINKLAGRHIDEHTVISTISSDDLVRLRAKLHIEDSISDADLLRELAVLAEKNDDIGLAYRLMSRAMVLRPSGPLIKSKLKYYEQRIENEKRLNS